MVNGYDTGNKEDGIWGDEREEEKRHVTCVYLDFNPSPFFQSNGPYLFSCSHITIPFS
jgi:hypothetical protein